MKKIIIAFALLLVTMTSVAQLLTYNIASGAKGVDSLNGAQTKYYYVKATGFTTAPTAPMSQYAIYAIQASTVRSVLTGSDSCQITFEVSCDNTNWHKYTGTTPKTVGGAVYTLGPDLVTTTTDGAAVFAPTSCYFPYVRVKFQHFKASCSMYPKCSVVLKKIAEQ